jgi:DUF4097 and DUF4098 domain-containing protein YvlB
MKSILRAGTAVLAGAVATGCVVSVDSQSQIVRDEKRFALDGTPELHLETFDGAIEIQSWDKPEVLVEIEKRGATREAVDALQVESSQRGNRIELAAKRPKSETIAFGFGSSASARLIVSVPRQADVTARTGDGSIRVERISGRLDLRTGDGAIKTSDTSGELKLSTGDGSVTVDRAEGRIALETGDGAVNVTGKLSDVKLHTGDGSIVYRVEPGASMADDWDISTGDGAVSLFLPRAFHAQVDAHTGDGGIRNDLRLVRESEGDRESDDEAKRRTLRGRLGDGGRVLRVRTGDGSISLKER